MPPIQVHGQFTPPLVSFRRLRREPEMNMCRGVDQPLDRNPWVSNPEQVSGSFADVPGDYNELLSGAIEAVGLGIILVATDGWILYANGMARDLMRCSRGVRSSSGRLVASTQEGAARLPDLAKVGSLPIVGAAGKSAIIALQRGEGVQHLFAHIVPGQQPSGGAAMFIVDPEHYAIPHLDAFASRYRMTPAEARVLNEIANGRGLIAVAKSLDIAESTARTHLRRVFAKTGTCRQTELLRLYLTGVLPDGA
jgi:DNA-binding CsgD family transcriptional regulator